VRAFSIYSDISIIVLNERDKPEIKLFSLFHEICHLLKRTSGICSIEMEIQPHQQIETFCNNFAAEFLVPEDDLKKEVGNFGTEIEGVKILANIYGTSKQVIMLRLLKLGCIDLKRYKHFTEGFDKELNKKKEGFHRRNWKKVYFNRVGNFAIQEVGKAYKKGDITFLESAKILNLKAKYMEKFVA
jgi:Zn-dependent peptidase ImmA (M78 family)